jgi:hypothetical protein
MWFFLAVIPWVLTTVALLIIIIRNKNKTNNIHLDDQEDYFDLDDIKDTISVAVYEDRAYWVYENVFYEAEVTREPDFSTASPIDTMSLSDKELKELMEVLDELERHNNERD